MAKTKQEFEVGEEIISYLRNSVGEKIPVRVRIDKIINNFGHTTYSVSNDVGGKFPTRIVKKITK
jgi:hypothetical protein